MRKSAWKIIPVCLLGLLAGLLNGLLGAGGGIVIVYGLNKLCRGQLRDPRAAFAGALAVMVPLSLFSIWRYARSGQIPQGAWQPLVLPAVLGGITGALLMRVLSARTLSRLFAAIVLISGIVLVA